jgi:hypothetical protein
MHCNDLFGYWSLSCKQVMDGSQISIDLLFLNRPLTTGKGMLEVEGMPVLVEKCSQKESEDEYPKNCVSRKRTERGGKNINQRIPSRAMFLYINFEKPFAKGVGVSCDYCKWLVLGSAQDLLCRKDHLEALFHSLVSIEYTVGILPFQFNPLHLLHRNYPLLCTTLWR